MSLFKEELLRATTVLNDYGQYDDALWLMNLAKTVNNAQIQKIFKATDFQIEMDDSHFISESLLKVIYSRKNDEEMLQKGKTLTLHDLSSKELFFISHSGYRLWSTSIFTGSTKVDITNIEKELIHRYNTKTIDFSCSYVLGQIWKLKNDNRSTACYLYSISQFPYFWSCWKELSDLVISSSLFNSISDKISNYYILKYFFLLLSTNNLIQSSTPLSLYNTLISIFPSNFFLQLQAATYYYNHHKLEQSLSKIHIPTTYALYDLNHYFTLYCNLYYESNQIESLFTLAQTVRKSYSLLPVLPLIEGSYWSLQNQHKKASEYINEATKRTADYYDAWLLLGHEYMDMKNPKVAMDCYHHAIRINNRDYRGYFALAQVYTQETNDTLAYYYYMRAVSLQEGLSKLWLVLGDFLVAKGKEDRALDAYQHGRQCDSQLTMRETRICLFHMCLWSIQHQEQSDITKKNCMIWLEAAATNNDDELKTNDGLIILRWTCQELSKSDYDEGYSLCKIIESSIQEPAVIEEIEYWLTYFRNQQKEAVDQSVSMDCSD